MAFAFAGKLLDHLERREKLCGHRPKTLSAAIVLGNEILARRIHCSYINVINRLYPVTYQSINDRREQNLRPDTSRLV